MRLRLSESVFGVTRPTAMGPFDPESVLSASWCRRPAEKVHHALHSSVPHAILCCLRSYGPLYRTPYRNACSCPRHQSSTVCETRLPVYWARGESGNLRGRNSGRPEGSIMPVQPLAEYSRALTGEHTGNQSLTTSRYRPSVRWLWHYRIPM